MPSSSIISYFPDSNSMLTFLAVIFATCLMQPASALTPAEENPDLIGDTIILKGYIDSSISIVPGHVFIVQQNVRINKNATLNVTPGSTLYFWPRTTVVIEGGLNIQGVPNNFATVTSLQPLEQGIGFIIRGKEGGDVKIEYSEISQLLVPIEFEPNWFRPLVEINDNVIKKISTGEPAVLVRRPDYERSFEKKSTGKFDFVRNVFSNNWGSIVFESFEDSRIEFSINDNLITNNVSYGRQRGEPRTSPLWGGYDKGENMDFVASITGNSIFGNYQINSKTDTIVHEVAFGITGEADEYKIPENFYWSKSLKYINQTLNHFYSNNELPLLNPKPFLKEPSAKAHAHISQVTWDEEEMKNFGNVPKVRGSKVAMEIQFNRPVTTVSNKVLEYAFFDTIDNILNVKRVGIFDTSWSADQSTFYFNIRNPRFLNNPMGYLVVNNLADDEGFLIPEFTIGQVQAINNYGEYYKRARPDTKIPSIEVIIDRAKVQISDQTLETIQKMIEAMIKREVEKFKKKKGE